MTGTLYLIPTPLDQASAASLIDLTLPIAVRETAARLDYFIAENAKTARGFLRAINTPLAIQSIDIAVLDVNTPPAELAALLTPILAGRDGGLVSEAGCPAIADPGANLVRLAHQHGISVQPLVGPSAILLAVMASGLNGQSFAFNGYLPIDPAKRTQRLRALEDRSRKERQTQVFIETPYRNAVLISALATNLAADTLVSVASDLTLSSQMIRTRTAAQWKADPPVLEKRPTVFSFLAGF